MKKIAIFALFIAVAIPSLSFSQGPLTKKEKVQAMYEMNKKLIKTQSYSFVAEWVFSDDKRSEVSEGLNTLEVNKSNVSALLSTLNSDKKTIKLNGESSNYTTEFNDAKHLISVTFKIDNYNAIIDIKPNGKVFLSIVNTSNDKTIKYRGLVK